MERYVLSCSFGKDSLASAILALHYDEPLDTVGASLSCTEIQYKNPTTGKYETL